MSKRKKTDLAWAAGFFEGEGSILIKRTQYPTYMSTLLYCYAAQVDIEPLEKLRTLFRGHIKIHKRATIRWNQTYGWSLFSILAADFLCAIRPYVTRPRFIERIDLALAFQAQKEFVGLSPRRFEYSKRQLEFFLQMKKLNTRGVPKQ